MRTTLFTVAMLFALVAQAAEVYRFVDDKGNVVFTDSPQKGAQKLNVEAAPATSVVIPGMPASAAPAAAGTQAKPGVEPFTGYQDFSITQPGANEPLLNTAGDVDVSMNLHPALRVDLGHGLTVLVDGQPAVENSSRLNLALNNIERGEHVLEAYVTDASGQVLIQAVPVRFSLQRPSLLLPGRQAPGAPLSPIPPPLPKLRTTP